MPLYSQLVSIYPKDPTYNYRFGVCVLFADRRETEKPIKYLEFAASKPDADIAVYYYLGLAYHNNYRFTEAIAEYNLYIEKGGSKTASTLDVKRQIEICKNAKELLNHFSDLYVLQKTEVAYKDFFRSYDVERFGGKILVKPDIFKTALDKKKEKFGLVFFSKENNEAYFSSYGKDGKTGKDIYKATKLPNGTWSKPVSLGPTINTAYDEDFPFLTSDGTLYYSSKGNNTIGDYDIFSSTLKEDGTWTTPENLNYPINTPFDDVMFIPDSSGQYAYFSSSRSSLEGMITVYKVRIDKRPEVKEILVLDKPANLTSGNGSDTAYAQTLQYLKEKATLEVNATETMFADKDATTSDNTVTENQNDNAVEDNNQIPDNITNEDIIKMADKQATESVNELKELKTQRDAARTIAQSRKAEAEKKYKESATIESNADSIKDENAKKTEIAKSVEVKSEADQLNKESAIALDIADQLDDKVTLKQKEADDATQYAKAIKTAVQSNNIDSSIALLTRMNEKLQSTVEDTSYIASSDQNKSFIKKKDKEAISYTQQANDVQEEVNSLKSQADNNRKQAENTKKKSEKTEFQKRAADNDEEANTKQSEADELFQKSEKAQAEADSARTQSTMYASIVDDIKNNNTAIPTVTSNQTAVSSSAQTNANNATAVNSTSIVSNKTTNSTATANNTNVNNTVSNINSNAANQVATNNTSAENNTNASTSQNTSTNQSGSITANANQTTANNTSNNNSTASVVTPNNTNNSTTGNTTVTQSTAGNTTTNNTAVANQVASNTNNNAATQTTANNVAANNNTSNASTSSQTATSNTSNVNNTATNQTTTNNAATTNTTALTTAQNSTSNQLTAEEQKQKAEILSTTDEIVKTLNKESDELKKQADNNYAVAADKNKQSQEKLAQADNLIAQASSTTNTGDKVKYTVKADELKKESVTLAQQAVISFSIAENLDNAYKEKQQDIVDAKSAIAAIRTLTDSNNIADAYDNFTDLKSSVSAKNNVATSTSQYKSDLASTLDSKEHELTQAASAQTKIQNKADSLNAKAKDLRQEANNTAKQSKKNDLQKQAEQLEQQASDIQKQSTASESNVEKLQVEVGELKMKIKYSTSLISEASDYTGSTTVDKSSLETKITEYENNNVFADTKITNNNNTTADNSTATTDTNIANNAGNQTTAVNTTTTNNQAAVTSNQSTTAQNNVTNTSTNTNTSEVSNLGTPGQLEAKANLIDKSVTSINSNVAVLQKDLNITNDKTEKDKLTKEITALKQQSATLQKEATETHTLAKKLNNSNEVTAVSNTPDTTLAADLATQASNDIDNATQKRIDANNTTDKTEKDQLRKEATDLEKTAQSKQLEALEIYDISNTDMYYTNSLKIDKITVADDKNSSLATAGLLENESKYYFDKAQALKESIKDDMTYAQKKSILDDVKTNQQQALEKQEKVMDIYSQATATATTDNTASTTNQAQADNTTAQNTTADNNKTTDNTTAVNSNNSASTTNVSANTTTSQDVTDNSTNTKTSAVSNSQTSSNTASTTSNNTATTTSTSTITSSEFKGISINNDNTTALNVDESNLVPLDSKLPDGIVFKVQIAAVRKHVAPEIFKGITPVTGETSPTGMYRYLAGLFAKFDDAVTSRDKIRTMGYADAFVVAYKNGVRISVGEALALLKSDNSLNTTYADLNNKTYVSSGSTTSATTTNTTAVNVASTATTASAANATTGLSNPVSSLNGLFYSVQVGVYARPVTSAQLFDISPLYDEIMANGYYRYISGTFTNLQDAVAARNTIVTKGVTDAFVVVYYNGKKISVAEAKTLAVGNVTLTTAATSSGTTENNISAVNNTATSANTTTTTNTAAANATIVFKVQVGAYKKDVPTEIINQWLDVAVSNGLEHTVSDAGLTIYTSGNFKDLKSASDYKNTLVSKGITDAFVVAFQGKEKIAVNKAVELLK